MIKVSKFTISTNDRKRKQPVKDVSIIPQNGGVFEFLDVDRFNEFVEQLRMAFEFIFVFGCTVEAKMCNEQTTASA